ncbi:MAG: hypothetical protein ACREB1_06520, partial [Sphingomicrobium sp.]
MPPVDYSAEYYCLREGHERALALAARNEFQRDEHLAMAARYGELARQGISSPEQVWPPSTVQAECLRID